MAEKTTTSPDLAALAGQYGIAPSATGNAYNDPDDLPVFVSYAPTKDKKGQVMNSGTLLRQFYAIKPDQLRELQKRLWAGGFYPRGADANQVIMGVHDELTYGAYQNLIDRSANFYAAGQKKTPDDVLDEAAGIWDQVNKSKGGRAGMGPDGGAGGGRQPLTVDLTAPEDLTAIAQKVAVGTLGRALTDQEVSRFITSFNARDAGVQQQAYGMAETGGTVTQAPNAAVAAETFARQAAPTEAGGNDFLKVYQSFSNILSRRGG